MGAFSHIRMAPAFLLSSGQTSAEGENRTLKILASDYDFIIALLPPPCYWLVVASGLAFHRPGRSGRESADAKRAFMCRVPGRQRARRRHFRQRKIKPRLRDAFDFDKFPEIKNSALLLAFASQEIKQIKEIKRRRRSPRLVGRGSSTELVPHFENSPIELKEGQIVRSANGLCKNGKAAVLTGHGA